MIRLAIPAIAVLIALYLYLRRQRTYLTFAFWCWLLTPLVRRLVDYVIGWEEPNFVLLTPMLVSMVAALDFLRPTKRAPLDLPPIVIFGGASVLYGFAIGMLLHPGSEVIYGLVNWMGPLLLGTHIALRWREYEFQQRWIARNAALGALIVGSYGVFQYVTAPAWDRFWLEQISGGLIDPSFGLPVPFGIRVWSTVNSPGPFGNVMLAMLLLLFATKSPLKLPGAIAGYMAFLLSVVRTAWLSWLLGLALMLRAAKPKIIARVVASLLVLALLVIPLIQRPEIAPVLGDRIKTFGSLKNDESYNERRDMYRIVGNVVLHDPFGHGLKNGEIVENLVVDSGVLVMLLSLGWLGVALYFVGILSFIFRRNRAKHDEVARATEAICLSFLIQLVGGPIFNNTTGAIFWLCMGLSLSADRWHAANPAAANVPDARRLIEV